MREKSARHRFNNKIISDVGYKIEKLRMVKKDDTTTGLYHTRQQLDCYLAVVEEAHLGHQNPGPLVQHPWVHSLNHAVNRGLSLASSQPGSDHSLNHTPNKTFNHKYQKPSTNEKHQYLSH